MTKRPGAIGLFHPAVAEWFAASFSSPTPPQEQGWPAIAAGDSTLILAPTGSGKTLTAFLWCLNRIMFDPVPARGARCRVLYISPLKALAVDIERNLRVPLAGIARQAGARGEAFHQPAVAIRTGDTPSAERARFARDPADILITTPESLYLLLTSNAREALRRVDTVIVDEIHALVPTKRGAHLALSLERLEHLCRRPIQRIGLSATQRPLDEVGRFLSGQPRPVTIVDTSAKKKLELTIEVPVEDMAKLGPRDDRQGAAGAGGQGQRSIWSAIHPRLLELVRSHRSTLIFVNSRRVAERLASALNDLAGETLVRSHHGSLARPQRVEVEERLKAGLLRGLVATSSLELGIDMGAIDLVVQIEAPPSVASGMQRIGRAGHTIDAASRGVIVPKFRGDLVACAAVTRAMHDGRIEAIRYPRNPLDVLAQQVVAMVAMDGWNADTLFAAVRGAAPFAELSRPIFDGVLDMLSGRYPSDDFADLRPRITWDRRTNGLTARDHAKRVAIINGGTIPDRGLYGVFLAGEHGPAARVGELDEEMVFETRVGETFMLGASTWRIEAVTHDRVLVSPAPGEPGKMPFWKADAPGRPLELGQQIGELVRSLRQTSPAAAVQRLVRDHDLDRQAAENLIRYLADQAAATGVVPDDRTILIERCRDDLGDWRVCVLSPFGGRVHAPWAMTVVERVRAEAGLDVVTMWTDDGFVVRFPETEEPPDASLMVPAASEAEALVVRHLGGTALFAAKFREASARALLLPRRRPGGRSPLWQQRKRAADLLGVAARYESFPMVLEAYRECLRDVFDIPAFLDTLRRIEAREITAVTVNSTQPSPFASALLFGYVANYLYDGDAPLAERRAQALAIDHTQLRELVGEVELRELLDADAIAETERRLQCLDADHHAKSVDGVHDLLLRLGDLSTAEIAARYAGDAAAVIRELTRTRRAIGVDVARQRRWIPVEYASRYRDALGVTLPDDLPAALVEPSPQAAADLARRFARTHGPFVTADFAARYAIARSVAESMLRALSASGRLVEGALTPGGSGREWCDPDVLQSIRRRSLARLRREVEPVDPAVLGRLVTSWQGVARRRAGLDALLDAIENLQGAPIAASIFESEVLAARIDGYNPADLDALTAAGEVVWCGVEPLGERDGRLAVYLADHLPRLFRSRPAPLLDGREEAIVGHLRAQGASFFAALHDAAGGGYPDETVTALWHLVWSGVITNDTFHALRAFTRPPLRRTRRPATGRAFRSRRIAPSSAEGRWSLVDDRLAGTVSPTEWSAATAQQLLSRYGVITREVAGAEGISGGFSAVYDALRVMEDAGRIRRGYFVSGVGATQFAVPAALDLLRSLKEDPDEPDTVVLSATDPANPYGTLLKWPEAFRLTRTVGALVVIVNGALTAYIGRGGRQLQVFLPEDEPARSTAGRALAKRLAQMANIEEGGGGLLVGEINGVPAPEHALAPYLVEAGFSPSAMGFHMRRHA